MGTYHKWRTVFVQIPKNASTSIHFKLRNSTDNDHNHKTYLDILSEQDNELIESYFSFAVVRNPYDRFISAYEFETQAGARPFNLTFNELILKLESDRLFSELPLVFTPQYKFVTIKSFILVDKIIRYENLNEEWKNISFIINEKNKDYNFTKISDKLEILNASSTRIGEVDDYYTEETKNIIYSLYKKDFELFNYKKD